MNVITMSAALSLAGTGINLIGDSVPAGGYLFILNQDPTNYVEVDSASTYDKFPQKITPGKFVLLMPETSTLHMKANTGSCNCYIVAVTL